jgi:hypothetical protein
MIDYIKIYNIIKIKKNYLISPIIIYLRLAKQKDDIRKRRTEREKQEKLKQIEQNRRKNEFDRLFTRFYLSEYGRLEIAIVNI